MEGLEEGAGFKLGGEEALAENEHLDLVLAGGEALCGGVIGEGDELG